MLECTSIPVQYNCYETKIGLTPLSFETFLKKSHPHEHDCDWSMAAS